MNIGSFLMIGSFLKEKSDIMYSYLYTKLLNLYYKIKKHH